MSAAPGDQPDGNARTIDTYDRFALEYVRNSPRSVSGWVKGWLDRAVAGLPHDARVLELGSGPGHDADYLNSLGYHVVRTDATPAFVDMLRSNGNDAQLLNAITDDLPPGFDLVIANAVLHHFTRPQAACVIAKARAALTPGGRFAFSLRLGEGESWSNDKVGAPRFFCYWTSSQIHDVLAQSDFTDIDIRENRNPDFASGWKDWLHITARKPMA
jgi:SAM-dependent methyltransferase